MARLLILAHAPLASALLEVARHAFPELLPLVQALDVPPEADPDAIEARARALMGGEGSGPDPDTLVLTDIFGATPANIAQRLADGGRVRVLAGVNVPMLWRALNYARLPLDELANRAMIGATQGVLPMVSTRPQNQTLNPNAHDPQHRHHQQ